MQLWSSSDRHVPAAVDDSVLSEREPTVHLTKRFLSFFLLTQAVSTEPSLYVSNIPPGTTVEDLHAIFAKFGVVHDAYFVTRGSPPASGLEELALSAIVKFDTWTEAEQAFDHFATDSSDSMIVKYARRSRGDAVSISSKRLFIGQLPTTVTEADIRAYFSQFGSITEISLLDVKPTGYQPAACAFVEFETWRACDVAIATAQDHTFLDPKSKKPMVVKYAKSRERNFHVHAHAHHARTGSLQELMHSYLSSSPPTTGYVVGPEQMTHAYSMPAYISPSPFIEFVPAVGQMGPAPYFPMTPMQSMQSSLSTLPGMMSIPVEDVDSRKIFVGQLPRAADEEDVASLFAMFGPIENVSVLRNSSARCGFVTFASRHQALVAVDAMHGAVPFPESRPIVVRLASRRGETAANAPKEVERGSYGSGAESHYPHATHL